MSVLIARERLTREVIVFPDVEQLVIDGLTPELETLGFSVPVATRVPDPRPDEFVRVIRTGGSRVNLVVEAAQITVEAYAARESRAERLAALCRGILPALDVVNGVQVYGVDEFAAPANLPDPRTTQHRYSATYAVRVRGAAA